MEKINANAIQMTKEYFGPLWEYVDDDNIINIDFNGRDIWIEDTSNVRRKLDLELGDAYWNPFCQRVANSVSKNFTRTSPILEAQTDRLRFSIGHESFAKTGKTVCIRKTLPMVRFTAMEAIEQSYCTQEILELLVNCVLAKCRFIIGGEVSAGKTECGKFLSQYIPKSERVVTVEDSLEWHYSDINPGSDSVELQISEFVTYSDAIKFALRQDLSRLLLSEARSVEVKELVEGWSNGASGMSTLHLNDIRSAPDRILNMMPSRQDADRLEKNVYQFIDIGILVKKKMVEIGMDTYKIIRQIDQVAFFDYDREKVSNNGCSCELVVYDGKIVNNPIIPKNKLALFNSQYIGNPWSCKILQNELRKYK